MTRLAALVPLSAVFLLSTGCASLANFAVASAGLPTLPDMPQPAFAPELSVPADGGVSILVNGRMMAARAGPGLPSRLLITAADAEALFGPAARSFDQRGDWPGATRGGTRVGPIFLRSHRARAMLSLAGGESAAPAHPAIVEWFSTEPLGTEPQLGPFAIPATLVRFALRPGQTGERSYSLPLDAEDNGWGIASTSLMVDGQRVRFAIAPHFPRSVASAAAGGALARAQGGRFLGIAEPVPISHGIARPARPVRLAHALAIGPVRLRDILVRTLDYGTATGIADQVETADDPADILVTGRTERQAPNYIVYLGADVLGDCSTISFDKAAMTVTLSCMTPG